MQGLRNRTSQAESCLADGFSVCSKVTYLDLVLHARNSRHLGHQVLFDVALGLMHLQPTDAITTWDSLKVLPMISLLAADKSLS